MFSLFLWLDIFLFQSVSSFVGTYFVSLGAFLYMVGYRKLFWSTLSSAGLAKKSEVGRTHTSPSQ
jgi:hypothetical protein